MQMGSRGKVTTANCVVYIRLFRRLPNRLRMMLLLDELGNEQPRQLEARDGITDV